MTMKGKIEYLLNELELGNVVFAEVIAFIDTHYDHLPTAFKNGSVVNMATENQGSAKVFFFGQLNNLNPQTTLKLFVEHYHSVLNNPSGNDHQNIREFMKNGWSGVSFQGQALRTKL